MFTRSVHSLFGFLALSLLGMGAPAPVWADAPPTQISACPYTITAPGNYAVTRNLTATGNCITLTPAVGGVTLDLQNHSITGNGTGFGIGCVSSSFECPNNIIANGTVARFAGGVVLQGSSNAIVNITSQQNNGVGPVGYGVGIYVRGAGGSCCVFENYVSNSSANNNSGAGIQGELIDSSSADNNGNDGMDGVPGGLSVVSNSEAVNNGGYGIVADVVTGSTARGNTQGGILLGGQYQVGVVNSTASGNGGTGISGFGNVLGNTTNNNGEVGISLSCPAFVSGNIATNNRSGNIVANGQPGCLFLDNKTAP